MHSDRGAAHSNSPPGDELPTRGLGGVWAGMRLVGLWTLVSRILGLARDMVMAACFGNSAVLDAFTVAFRIPNMARRLFGEGALTAVFLPSLVRSIEKHGQTAGWKLASSMLVHLSLGLTGLVIAGEVFLGLLLLLIPMGDEGRLLIGLTSVMLPYLILICLAAQVSSILHGFDQFGWPAFLPIILNTVWIACLAVIVPSFESQVIRVYLVAVSIVLAGFLQLLFLLPRLRRLGFRFLPADSDVRQRVRQILRAMLPVLIGLSITQFNTLADSLIAWGLTGVPDDSPLHLEPGTASALYFGQRLYQFPLGVFGVALGTALFPRLSRHAARSDMLSLRNDLSLGLRLVIGIGLPASLGLVLMAEPLTSLLFVRGAFTSEDGRNTAAMIAAYGTGVWAYCGLLIVTRAYYALDDRTTPLRIGLMAVAVNLPLNFLLIVVVGAPGLALATAATAALQVVLATWFVQRHVAKLQWAALGLCLLRAAVATSVMGAVCGLVLWLLPADASLGWQGLRVVVPVCVAGAAYFAVAHLLGLHEWKLLVWRTADVAGTPHDLEADGSQRGDIDAI